MAIWYDLSLASVIAHCARQRNVVSTITDLTQDRVGEALFDELRLQDGFVSCPEAGPGRTAAKASYIDHGIDRVDAKRKSHYRAISLCLPIGRTQEMVMDRSECGIHHYLAGIDHLTGHA